MTCKKCEEFQNSGSTYPFRWKHATILIIACEEHFKEIRKKLMS